MSQALKAIQTILDKYNLTSPLADLVLENLKYKLHQTDEEAPELLHYLQSIETQQSLSLACFAPDITHFQDMSVEGDDPCEHCGNTSPLVTLQCGHVCCSNCVLKSLICDKCQTPVMFVLLHQIKDYLDKSLSFKLSGFVITTTFRELQKALLEFAVARIKDYYSQNQQILDGKTLIDVYHVPSQIAQQALTRVSLDCATFQSPELLSDNAADDIQDAGTVPTNIYISDSGSTKQSANDANPDSDGLDTQPLCDQTYSQNNKPHDKNNDIIEKVLQALDEPECDQNEYGAVQVVSDSTDSGSQTSEKVQDNLQDVQQRQHQSEQGGDHSKSQSNTSQAEIDYSVNQVAEKQTRQLAELLTQEKDVNAAIIQLLNSQSRLDDTKLVQLIQEKQRLENDLTAAISQLKCDTQDQINTVERKFEQFQKNTCTQTLTTTLDTLIGELEPHQVIRCSANQDKDVAHNISVINKILLEIAPVAEVQLKQQQEISTGLSQQHDTLNSQEKLTAQTRACSRDDISRDKSLALSNLVVEQSTRNISADSEYVQQAKQSQQNEQRCDEQKHCGQITQSNSLVISATQLLPTRRNKRKVTENTRRIEQKLQIIQERKEMYRGAK